MGDFRFDTQEELDDWLRREQQRELRESARRRRASARMLSRQRGEDPNDYDDYGEEENEKDAED